MSDPLLLRVQHPETGPRYVLQDGEVVADVSEPVGSLADWLAREWWAGPARPSQNCVSRPLQQRHAGRGASLRCRCWLRWTRRKSGQRA